MEQEIEDLVNEISPCKSLRHSHPKCYEFFYNLFQKHPNAKKKRVHKIIDISISGKFDAPGGPVFRIYYPWGWSDTISWRKCIH